MIERVAIVGVGLIGGSLALAWKERHPSLHITGFDRPEVLEAAQSRGILDETAHTLPQALERADVVVLAVPLAAMEIVLTNAVPHLKPGAIVTDVGSVKVPIMSAATRQLGADHVFVGGHPMAGAEQSGLSNADGFLFENATYVLCPSHKTDAVAYGMLVELVEATGARVLAMDAEQHDRVAACVSHLPQLVATTLMDVVARRSHVDAAVLELAAGGFRDMTRIASSPFALWASILEANYSEVTQALDELMAALLNVRTHITMGDYTELAPVFDRARAVRETIPKDFKGFLQPLADVYVYAEDQPGVLAHITGSLFACGINIKDLALLKIREGTGGAFRVSFKDEATADAAVVALNEAGCRAHRLK